MTIIENMFLYKNYNIYIIIENYKYLKSTRCLQVYNKII